MRRCPATKVGGNSFSLFLKFNLYIHFGFFGFASGFVERKPESGTAAPLVVECWRSPVN